MKKILMIAFHFPPFSGSSGVQRTLRFVQHFPALGWQPLVLSAQAQAFEKTSSDLLGEVPEGVLVERAFALDTARHLQFKGRYLGWMARPDRWVSWQLDAVRRGLQLIKAHQPDVIWSTYPIASAHAIASVLQQKTKLPWVADFRDPMAQDAYPSDPKTWQCYQAIEADATLRAKACVFTTPGAARMYKARYPLAAGRMRVVENGYDEESFSLNSVPKPPSSSSPFILLHSGLVYPSERDPTQLFEALSQLQQSGQLNPSGFRLRFRASGQEGLLKNLGVQYGVSALIELMPPIAYREALEEMMAVNALLVMQASNCNAQIPAKIYEYLRARKPILGLTDPNGDTAWVLKNAGINTLARLDSTTEIVKQLSLLLDQYRMGISELPHPRAVHQASRHKRSASMVLLLNEMLR
jgi:hypothetical protein